MRAWVLLSAVLWYLAGVGWQRSSIITKEGFVYGKVGRPVKLYVELHHNSPVLLCTDFKRAQKETVDPTYLWIGPNEKPLTGTSRINITKTGKLLVKDFLEPLSGLYTCTLSYKTVKAETQEEKTVKQRYDFMLFVNPFAPRWKGTCNESVDCEDTTNHNILQARDRIEEFFRRQAYIFKHDFKKTLPAMHFVDHSFHIMRMDSCRPGFGKNEGLHSNCASCCVVCSPGTFSPDVDVTCQTCVSTRIYGAKTCP
ncbi:zona pellucida-binding protein 2 isoform X3 [Camelus dromedarius]|uniref:Zona pellucida-binding protein 2 isoform X4 n=2 Tax=Camelus TaxID=9836 RepID=A0A8B6YBS4_CAMFR|nr:zona pellucida-binding protein 2 isoform X4 [Camelus ferus]XP_010958766.1 zona pellucida-binding protein 2 isoform X1 [Camelus bactrianus]XP_010990113.1 zona pellucida-binding protein 2 isoform X1 [Camelus dromedarius]